jgi:NADPH2:quinone reductase
VRGRFDYEARLLSTRQRWDARFAPAREKTSQEQTIMMRALVCHAFGEVEDLKVESLPIPSPGEGQARVRVHAAGINFPDLLIVQGKYQWKPPLPYTPGLEGAGVVEAIGPGVKGVKVGDRVIVSAIHTLADYALATADELHPMPANMTFEEAAGFYITYTTSYYALKQRAQLRAGETLLVLGAAGGVGITAVELGKVMGARVIAAASSPEKLAFCRDAGADEVIDYTQETLKDRVKELTSGRGPDVIYDPVGGALSETAFRTIGLAGRHMVVGFAGGDIPKLALNLPLLKNADIRGVLPEGWAARFPEERRRNIDELLDMIASGRIRPRVGKVYPFEDYAAALKSLSERQALGKSVVRLVAS